MARAVVPGRRGRGGSRIVVSVVLLLAVAALDSVRVGVVGSQMGRIVRVGASFVSPVEVVIVDIIPRHQLLLGMVGKELVLLLTVSRRRRPLLVSRRGIESVVQRTAQIRSELAARGTGG
ncbi:hypothetical protein C8F01DRAFT_1129354 [Mycena amicta]|nr:hypothetical protein C8F01DRAFT_1129354 [Mycena amicta]